MGGSTVNIPSDKNEELQEFIHFKYAEENGEIPSDMRCPLCTHVLSQPKMAACGDVFCNNCISKITDKRCPLCLTDFHTALAAPRILVNMLSGLKVNCLTCNALTPRGDFSAHFWTNCRISCPYECGVEMYRAELKDHELKVCPNRPTKCVAADVGCPNVCAPHLVQAHVAKCAYVQMRPALQKMQGDIAELKNFVSAHKAKQEEKQRKRLECGFIGWDLSTIFNSLTVTGDDTAKVLTCTQANYQVIRSKEISRKSILRLRMDNWISGHWFSLGLIAANQTNVNWQPAESILFQQSGTFYINQSGVSNPGTLTPATKMGDVYTLEYDPKTFTLRVWVNDAESSCRSLVTARQPQRFIVMLHQSSGTSTHLVMSTLKDK